MAQDYFLKIDGIEGESTDERHRGEIELEAWSFGGTNSGPSETGGGGGTGKFNAQDFQFTTRVSKASPILFLNCATGEHLPKATMTGRKAGDRPVDYLTITLTNVLISSYQQSGASGSGPMEQVSLNYTKIEIEYKEQRSDGTFGDSVKAGFDLKTNSPPPAPASAPDMTPASDSGVSNTDNITNVTMPSFVVPQPRAGETPSLYVDGSKVDSLFILIPTTPLSDGVHAITSTVTNAVGESPESPPLVITIDTVAPGPPEP